MRPYLQEILPFITLQHRPLSSSGPFSKSSHSWKSWSEIVCEDKKQGLDFNNATFYIVKRFAERTLGKP